MNLYRRYRALVKSNHDQTFSLSDESYARLLRLEASVTMSFTYLPLGS